MVLPIFWCSRFVLLSHQHAASDYHLHSRREAPLLQQFLLEQNPLLNVGIADSLSSLTEAVHRFDGNVRIISFLAETIVPATLLSQLQITP
ncbi:MAG: hypothetical protein JKX99_05575 [Robiginitomaculum sp.]|nr:hypothetical protein [Robiginitomaculum sp.]